MKTPIQELIDDVNHQINYLIQMQFEDERWRTINYDVTIKVLGEIDSILRGVYLEKEKDVIEGAFLDGYTHSPDDGFPEYAKNYYNEKFNTKE